MASPRTEERWLGLKPERWRQIEQLYDRALEMEESRRASFLREACAGDDDLRRELEQLLAEGRHAESFMEQPALREIAHEFAATAGSSWVGRQIGNYQFVSLVGAGGMGEVYRARDTKLKRDVAIKVLPSEFSRDPDRVSRFQREAQVLASLNHPNVAAIYDLEESNGLRFLIIELVEGSTLADRLKRGPIPLDDALRIATQIAEGLEAAHERGIVHRDLKPANIKLTPEDKVKVLDFGLAKAFSVEASEVNLANSPTLFSGTAAGIILGTAAYMSPEQAKGQNADRTSDVWAFGCVLYEMLTAKPVFTGETATEIMGRVLETEPNWDRLPAQTPEGIRNLLGRCLRKERRSRLHDIADARIEIEEVQSGSRHKEREAVVSRRSFVTVAGIAALAMVLAGTFVGSGLYFRSALDKTAEQRVEISLPPTAGSFALSPDGRKLVFLATTEGQSRLWLRLLDSTEPKLLAGTEDAMGTPFWSPNSESVGFFGGMPTTLKRLDVTDGSVQQLSPTIYISPQSRVSGTWNQNDVIVFAPNVATPLYRVSAKGGKAEAVTRLDPPRQLVHFSPQFLPDGNHFLFYADGTADGRGVYVGSLESPEVRRLFDASAAAVFVPPKYLLFIRQGTLLAQGFDMRKLAPLDEPVPVAEQAGSVSAAGGVIAYRSQTANEAKLTWFDRAGNSLGAVGEPLLRMDEYGGAALSRDSKWLALHRTTGGNFDVYLLDMMRGVTERLTTDPIVEGYPVWSPDSKRIVFKRGPREQYVKSTDGIGQEELLLTGAGRVFDWSADGRFIVYGVYTATGAHLYVSQLTLEGKVMGKPVSLTNANPSVSEVVGRFSPDGRWIVYQSNQSGPFQIYLQPFPGPGKRKLLSLGGGTQVRWPRQSKEVFYIDQDSKLMAVPVALSPDGQSADVGIAVPVAPNLRIWPGYVMSTEGQRILMNAVTGQQANPPITLILHWKPPGSDGK